MAGDWLKFEANTPEKPEVLAITIELGYDDPDLTVGKLLKVWRWFDQHTVNGNANNVTSLLLDRLIGVTGITKAMANVGWLVINDANLTLPNFDRHNGKTAKDRALTAKRVAIHKASKVGNDDSVTSALPREEKRREEVNTIGEENKSSHKQKKSIGKSLPSDWVLPKNWGDWALKEKPNFTTDQIRSISETFKDHWIANANQANAKKSDWEATWRNWVRRQTTPPIVVVKNEVPDWKRGML